MCFSTQYSSRNSTKNQRLAIVSVFMATTFAFARAQFIEPPSPEYRSYLAHIAAADGALRLNESSEAQRWLDAALPGERGWEWRYLNALTDESWKKIFTATHPIRDMSIASNGSMIALALTDGSIQLYDMHRGQEREKLSGHMGNVYSTAFNPDGTQLVSAGEDKTVRIWDVATGKETRVYTGHPNAVAGALFTPDGKAIISCSWERTPEQKRVEGVLHWWDAATGELRRRVAAGEKPLSCLALSPDGKTLAAGSWDSYVFLFDLDSDAAPRKLNEAPGPNSDIHVNAVTFSHDGVWVAAACDDRATRVWRVADGGAVATLRGHPASNDSLSFSNDNKLLATGGADANIRLWSTESWSQVALLPGHRADVRALIFPPGGEALLSAGADRSVLAWIGKPDHYAALHLHHGAACYATPFFPDSERIATCGYDGTLAIWNVNSGERLAHWKALEGQPANTVTISGDGKLLATCAWNGAIRIIDAATQKESVAIQAEGGVSLVAFNPDATRLAAALTNNNVDVFDVATGERIRSISGHEKRVESVAFSPDGASILSCASDRTARVWNAATGELRVVLRGHESPVYSGAFSPDGTKIATGGGDGTVRLWETQSGNLLGSLFEGDQTIFRVTFSPDGQRVAAASTTVLLLDARRGGLVLRLRPHNDTAWSLSFSPDGRRLATCSWDGTIAVLDTVLLGKRTK